MLRPLDVIWIPDDTIRPPAPKMVVCVSPADNWFYRINTRGHHRPCVPLLRLPEHAFLKHDSFLEVGEPLELDDYIIEEALACSGVIGRVDKTLCVAILSHLTEARFLSDVDKTTIRKVLEGL